LVEGKSRRVVLTEGDKGDEGLVGCAGSAAGDPATVEPTANRRAGEFPRRKTTIPGDGQGNRVGPTERWSDRNGRGGAAGSTAPRRTPLEGEGCALFPLPRTCTHPPIHPTSPPGGRPPFLPARRPLGDPTPIVRSSISPCSPFLPPRRGHRVIRPHAHGPSQQPRPPAGRHHKTTRTQHPATPPSPPSLPPMHERSIPTHPSPKDPQAPSRTRG
jgi:hypothetical protein